MQAVIKFSVFFPPLPSEIGRFEAEALGEGGEEENNNNNNGGSSSRRRPLLLFPPPSSAAEAEADRTEEDAGPSIVIEVRPQKPFHFLPFLAFLSHGSNPCCIMCHFLLFPTVQ